MKFRYKKITTAILALMITAAAAMTFTACGDSGSDSSADTGSGKGNGTQKEEAVDLSILCVGDIMAHSKNKISV